jgi:hypothetical protein
VRVHLAIEHALQLEAAHACFEPDSLTLDILRGALVVFAFRELQELRGIGDRLGRAVQLGELGSQLGAFAPELLCLVGLLPDRRVLQLATDLLEALLLGVVLKETP